MGIIKVGLLFRHRKKFGAILKVLQNAAFNPDWVRSGGNDFEAKLIRDHIRKTEIQLLVYFFIISGTYWSGLFTSFKSWWTKPSDEWVFPFAPYMTFIELRSSPLFEIGSILQGFLVAKFAVAIATTYVLLSVIIGHVAIQMKILGNAFKLVTINSFR